MGRPGDSRYGHGSLELCEGRDLITAGRRGRQEGTSTAPYTCLEILVQNRLHEWHHHP